MLRPVESCIDCKNNFNNNRVVQEHPQHLILTFPNGGLHDKDFVTAIKYPEVTKSLHLPFIDKNYVLRGIVYFVGRSHYNVEIF